MKKILVLGLLLIVVVSGLGVWGYVMGTQKSNSRNIKIGSREDIEVLFSIPSEFDILIPQGAIPTSPNEVTELDIQVFVATSKTPTFRILQLPDGFMIKGWSQNAQYQTNSWVDLKLILTKDMNVTSYSLFIEIELIF